MALGCFYAAPDWSLRDSPFSKQNNILPQDGNPSVIARLASALISTQRPTILQTLSVERSE